VPYGGIEPLRAATFGMNIVRVFSGRAQMAVLDHTERKIIKKISLLHAISLQDSHLDALGLYLDELIRWNHRMNLIGVDSRERIIQELLIDSLLPAPFLPETGTLLDVGSGAGFPAIPLKIYLSGLDFHLMESQAKKTSFLKQAIRLTGLKKTTVLHGRVERDTHLLRGEGYHAVTARAVANMAKTISWCAPHLKRGGKLLCFAGEHADDRLRDVSDLLQKLGMMITTKKPYLLPGMRKKRHLIVLEKK